MGKIEYRVEPFSRAIVHANRFDGNAQETKSKVEGILGDMNPPNGLEISTELAQIREQIDNLASKASEISSDINSIKNQIEEMDFHTYCLINNYINDYNPKLPFNNISLLNNLGPFELAQDKSQNKYPELIRAIYSSDKLETVNRKITISVKGHEITLAGAKGSKREVNDLLAELIQENMANMPDAYLDNLDKNNVVIVLDNDKSDTSYYGIYYYQVNQLHINTGNIDKDNLTSYFEYTNDTNSNDLFEWNENNNEALTYYINELTSLTLYHEAAHMYDDIANDTVEIENNEKTSTEIYESTANYNPYLNNSNEYNALWDKEGTILQGLINSGYQEGFPYVSEFYASASEIYIDDPKTLKSYCPETYAKLNEELQMYND